MNNCIAKPRRRSTRKRIRVGRDQRRGVTTVEFAIISNVLFLMIFACIEFARVNMVRNLSNDAAYFAARTVMVPGATTDEAIDEVDRIMSSMLSNGYSVSVDEMNDESSHVSVTVTVDLTEVALFTPMFFTNQSLSSTARLRTERYNGFYQQ